MGFGVPARSVVALIDRHRLRRSPPAARCLDQRCLGQRCLGRRWLGRRCAFATARLDGSRVGGSRAGVRDLVGGPSSVPYRRRRRWRSCWPRPCGTRWPIRGGGFGQAEPPAQRADGGQRTEDGQGGQVRPGVEVGAIGRSLARRGRARCRGHGHRFGAGPIRHWFSLTGYAGHRIAGQPHVIDRQSDHPQGVPLVGSSARRPLDSVGGQSTDHAAQKSH